MNQQMLFDVAIILLFGSLFLFGIKTGTAPGIGPIGLSFDRDTQPRRFWLLMTFNGAMVLIGVAAALGLIA